MISNITSFKSIRQLQNSDKLGLLSHDLSISEPYKNALVLSLINSRVLENNEMLVIVVDSLKNQLRYEKFLNFHFPSLLVETIKPYNFYSDAKNLSHYDQRLERVELYSRERGKGRIVLVEFTSLLEKSPSVDEWKSLAISVEVGDEVDLETLISNLNKLSYDKKDRVFKKLEYATRGSVVDIFPGNFANPVRIEFLGDLIVSIRFFDVNSMASVSDLKKLEILPASKYPVKGSFDDCQQQVHEELIKLQVNRWNRKEITDAIISERYFNDQFLINPLYWGNKRPFLTLFKKYLVLSLFSKDTVSKLVESYFSKIEKNEKMDRESGEVSLNADQYIIAPEEFYEYTDQYPALYIDSHNTKAISDPSISMEIDKSSKIGSLVERIKYLFDLSKNYNFVLIFTLNHQKSLAKYEYLLDGLDLFANRKQISLSELLNEDISLKSNIFNYSMLSLGGYLYDDDKRTLYVPDLFNINLSGTEKRKRNSRTPYH